MRWLCVAIFAATLLAYLPALGAGFIWDDHPGHVTRPDLQSLAGLGRIWFEVGATQQYYPLLYSAFWLEHQLWGEAAFGYHLLNVLLHATAACLVGVALTRLAVRGAWLAAVVFALHPVGVESVAWISEQKNTLSLVFYLCAVLAWLRFDEERTPRAYVRATLWFIAALLTKTVTATLPAALLVLVWWRRGRIEARRDVSPLALWFALGIGAGALTAWVEHAQIGAQGGDFALGAVERGLLAGRVAWFYAGKLLWPAGLVFIYPRWAIDAAQLWQWSFVLAAAGAIAAAWWWRRRSRGPLAAVLFFGGTLVPALGFVNVFPFVYSYVADHFQYIASLGLIALVASAGTVLTAELSPTVRKTAAALVLATLGLLTWRQASTYRDAFTLYTATIAGNPACWMAHNNLGIALVDAGRAEEALPHYEAALKLRADYAEGENNYGYALNQLGRAREALPHLQRAVALRLRYAEAYNNLGAAHMALGQPADGLAAFAKATEINPRFALAQLNHGVALASGGRVAEAISKFQRALQIDPDYADAELQWGIALTVQEHAPEALPHFERALALQPDWPRGLLSYGRALASLGRLDDAIARFRAAAELQPASAEAHYHLALALKQSGRLDEAAAEYKQALQLGWK